MSVIVKGMEMPDHCWECWLMRNLICGASGELIPSSGKREHCPIVALPDKHGRLGDLDELWERMLKYTDNEGAKMPYGDDDSLIHRDSVCFMIESADTIIEAEGAEG